MTNFTKQTMLDLGNFGEVHVEVDLDYTPGTPPSGFSGPPENYDPGSDPEGQINTIYIVPPTKDGLMKLFAGMDISGLLTEEALEELYDSLVEGIEDDGCPF